MGKNHAFLEFVGKIVATVAFVEFNEYMLAKRENSERNSDRVTYRSKASKVEPREKKIEKAQYRKREDYGRRTNRVRSISGKRTDEKVYWFFIATRRGCIRM